MIPKYIDYWLTIIEQMNNDNTYKLAWGRALIECICLDGCYEDNGEVYIGFDEIAKRMIKYYWNQLFFFKLKQSPYKDKEPVICKDVNMLIEEWKKNKESVIPVWYDEDEVRKNNSKLFDIILKHVSKTLHENVSWRFMNIPTKALDIYKYDKANNRVIFSYDAALLIKEDYGIVLTKLLNYKWTQLLEKFNYQPKIASKVSGISNNKIRRNNLSKYKNELLKEYNGKAIDFYTGQELAIEDISVDHVIPWSFMYSDDIWNLVLTSKSNNSIKSNSIPSEEDIRKLKERNNKIKDIVSDSFKLDIEEALNNDYLDKFYYECRI